MGWRTIFVDNATKLSMSLDNLIIVHNNDKYSIALSEVESIIVTDYKCVITTRLLARCCELGINCVFTKQNKMPVGAIHSLENNSRASKIFKQQIIMSNEKRRVLWQQIIKQKLSNQAMVLRYNRKKYEIVYNYIKEVELGDITNKEGQAARVYFKALFGDYFKRGGEDIINYALNYTYQILRSKIAQSLVAKGLNPSLGIYHRNEYNYFNLADDIIEVFRPLADQYVLNITSNYHLEYLTPKLKVKLVDVINQYVVIDKKKYKMTNAIDEFTNDIIRVVNSSQDQLEIKPRLYEE